MECLSTDMLGNSQPTGGVFSGDNFAQGDARVPMPLGYMDGMVRRDVYQKPRKKKARRNGRISK